MDHYRVVALRGHYGGGVGESGTGIGYWLEAGIVPLYPDTPDRSLNGEPHPSRPRLTPCLHPLLDPLVWKRVAT
eukprot:2406750-Pyramimonas_sp.AAC.1